MKWNTFIFLACLLFLSFTEGPKPNLYPVNIPYIITGEFTERDRLTIDTTLDYFSQVTCVKFVPKIAAPPEGPYFNLIFNKTFCGVHWLGYESGHDEHSIYLFARCLERPGGPVAGSVLHECNHALGFPHEHQRPNRDEYIEVHWGNITQTVLAQSQFAIYNETYLDVGPYDYYSIMHYGERYLSINRNVNSFSILKTGIDSKFVGQRIAFTETDANKINQVYGCPDWVEKAIKDETIKKVQLGSTGTYVLWPKFMIRWFPSADDDAQNGFQL